VHELVAGVSEQRARVKQAWELLRRCRKDEEDVRCETGIRGVCAPPGFKHLPGFGAGNPAKSGVVRFEEPFDDTAKRHIQVTGQAAAPHFEQRPERHHRRVCHWWRTDDRAEAPTSVLVSEDALRMTLCAFAQP